jgi:L-alanine-DL-glutamate epimerase-like enolase superfamily enzyme
MSTHILDRITVHRLRIPLTVPYRLAIATVEHYDTLVVECVARDGSAGIGEATVLTGYTDETIEESWAAAREMAQALVSLDGARAKLKLGELVDAMPFTATAFGTAIEMLEGSAMLRVERATPVPILGIVNATGAEGIGREVESLLEAGYRTLKVKVGMNLAKDIAHVATAQRLVRGRARIRIDANQGFSRDDGIAFVRALDPAGVELFEQPCAAGDWDAHLAVVREAGVPMMLDESIYGMADVERAAELKAARFVKLKLMKLGSMQALAAALERIRSLGMSPVLGNGVAADLGCWMEACVAARHIDNAGEMNGFLKVKARILSEDLEVRDAAIVLRPGFAPRLAPDRFAPHLVASHVATRPVVPAGA